MADSLAEARARRQYKRFRDDGWPYCPQCDEDELWSSALYASIHTIVGCYRCDFRPEPAGPREQERANNQKEGPGG